MVSGTIQMSGIEAMLWEMKAVTETSASEPSAASTIQLTVMASVTGEPGAAASSGISGSPSPPGAAVTATVPRLVQAAAPHRSTKST